MFQRQHLRDLEHRFEIFGRAEREGRIAEEIAKAIPLAKSHCQLTVASTLTRIISAPPGCPCIASIEAKPEGRGLDRSVAVYRSSNADNWAGDIFITPSRISGHGR